MKKSFRPFELFFVYFLIETVFLNSIQIVTAIIRNDVMVSRVQSSIMLVVIPIICPFLLLVFGEKQIPDFFHKITHVLSAFFNLLLCGLLIFSGWMRGNISLDFQIMVWFLSLAFTSLSVYVTQREIGPIKLLVSEIRSVKDLRPYLQFLIPFLLSVGLLSLLKFPGLYWGISGCIHLVFFGYLFYRKPNPQIEKVVPTIEGKLENITPIVVIKIIRNISKYVFYFLSLLLAGMIWSDRWKIAASPDYFFPIMYRLLISPFLYLGFGLYVLFSWLSRKRERNYGLLIIGPLVLLSLLGITILAPITLGYSSLFLTHQALKSKSRMMKYVFILLYQLGFFGSYLMLLAKWTIPWVTELISNIQVILLWIVGTLLILMLFLNELSRNLEERKEEIRNA